MKKRIFFSLVFLFLPLIAGPFRPIPWLTTDSIKFLEQYFLENKNPRVLEFGSGASTIWFARRTNHLVSIEHQGNWYRMVKKRLKEVRKNHVKLILKPKPYFSICSSFEKESFDLIVVDGRHRIKCIKGSIPLLKPGGVMMLDNADKPWFSEAYEIMSSWKCVETEQVGPDACGFSAPGWKTTWWIKPKQENI